MVTYTRETYLVILHPLSQKVSSRQFEYLDGDPDATPLFFTLFIQP